MSLDHSNANLCCPLPPLDLLGRTGPVERVSLNAAITIILQAYEYMYSVTCIYTIHMHKCAHVYVYYVHVYIPVFVCSYMYVYMCIYMYIYIYTYMYVYIYMCVDTRVYTYNTYQMYVYMYMFIYIHIHTSICLSIYPLSSEVDVDKEIHFKLFGLPSLAYLVLWTATTNRKCEALMLYEPLLNTLHTMTETSTESHAAASSLHTSPTT